jgi:hypothetical protein
MRKFIGFLLFISGLVFAAFAYYPQALDREPHLADLTQIVAGPAGDVAWRPADAGRRAPLETGSIPSFAPAQPMMIELPARKPAAPVQATRSGVSYTEVAVASPVAQTPVAPPPHMAGWQALVTQDSGIVPAGVTSSKPGDDHARYELVMNLQRELKRAGCYGGTMHGSWTANTKRAMSAFMDRVNATLPMDEPDYILLTLIKGQPAASCITCPQGQSLRDGRCMPDVMIAQTPKKPTRSDERMTAAEPKPAGFTTMVAPSVSPTPAAPAAVAARAQHLPGRMAVGGPSLPAPQARPALPGWSVKIIATPKTVPAPMMPEAAGQPPALAPGPVPPNAETAALEPQPDVASSATETEAAVTAPVAQAYAAPRAYVVPRPQRAAPARVRSEPRRRSTRSVQNLFMHPLGRL